MVELLDSVSNPIPDNGCDNECDPRSPPHCSKQDQESEEGKERTSENPAQVCCKFFHGIAPCAGAAFARLRVSESSAIRDENGRSLPQITEIGLWILCNLWIDLDVEVAIDLERFDLFGEFESLLCFGRRYLRFLAVDQYSQRHCETFDDAFVVK